MTTLSPSAVRAIRPTARVIDPNGTMTRVFAAGAVFLVAVAIPLGEGVRVGDLIAAVLTPVWWPALARYRYARLLLGLAVVAVLSGIALSQFASHDHLVTRLNIVDNSVLILSIALGAAVMLWARTVVATATVALAYGAGLLVSIAINGVPLISASQANNPWKFGYAVPVAIIVLALTSKSRSATFDVLALAGLGIMSATHDSRSYLGEFTIAVLLVAWQRRPWRGLRRASAFMTVVVLGLIMVVVYQLATSLFVGGALGASVQQRSQAAIASSGSLLVGGRPEMTAALALFRERPIGFGSGTAASASDELAAKSGMMSINYNPANTYFQNYMFGTKIELHSVLSDSWAYFGFAGILIVLFIALLMLRTLGVTVAEGRGSALVIFLSVFTLWNLFFSPLFGSSATMTLALGIGLLATRSTAVPRLDGWLREQPPLARR